MKRVHSSNVLNERCYICNKVSSEFIETNIGDATSKSFFWDSHDLNRGICEECKAAHEDLMLAYEIEDGQWRPYDNDNDDLEEADLEDFLLDDYFEARYAPETTEEISDQD